MEEIISGICPFQALCRFGRDIQGPVMNLDQIFTRVPYSRDRTRHCKEFLLDQSIFRERSSSMTKDFSVSPLDMDLVRPEALCNGTILE